MSALKNNIKRGRYPVNKNPSQDQVKCGRSNETKLWKTHQGYMRSHYVSGLTSVLTLLPGFRQLLKDLKSLTLFQIVSHKIHILIYCRRTHRFNSLSP